MSRAPMKLLIAAVVALLVITIGGVPVHADGPETGVATGRVTDNSGALIPGAIVTIAGDRGEQSVVTDENGVYRFALLRPGNYVITASLDGFRDASANASITAGYKGQYDFRLRLETSEEITVTSEAPMVDKYNVTAGQSVTSEVGAEAAGTTRTYYGVINMLPGVTSDADNRDIQEMRPSVNGSHFADQGVYIDGVDTTFARLGGSRVILPTTATSEVTMEAGGASAEYGRVTGSSTNVIIKSGTNSFHGDLVGIYSDADWFGEYKDQPVLETLEFGAAPRDFFKRTQIEKDQTAEGVEASLGGPIFRDKAWFFAAFSDSSTGNFEKLINGSLIDTSWEYQAKIGKVNFQPHEKHSLSASWVDSPSTRNYVHTPQADEWGHTPHVLSGDLGTFNWNYSISQSVFLETKIATQTSNEHKLLATGDLDVEQAILTKQRAPNGYPGDPNLASSCAFANLGGQACHFAGNNFRVYVDDQDNDSWHNGWILDNGFGLNEYPRDQANAALTWFANDNHEVKFGVDWQEVSWIQDAQRMGFYSGPNFDPSSPSGYAGNDHSATPGTETGCSLIFGRPCLWINYQPDSLVAAGRGTGDSENENLTLYVRDRFTIGDRWTFNAGVRFSQQENLNDTRRKVVDTETLEPRLAMSYDFKGDGTMLASVNVGRYYAQLNQQFTNRWLLDEWAGHNASDEFLYCDNLDVLFIPACGGEPGYNLFFRAFRPGEQFDLADAGVISPIDLDPYYKDEIIAGFEWQFSDNWAVDLKGIYWELGDMIMNTTQRDPDLRTFSLSSNVDNIRNYWRELGVVPEHLIEGFEDPFKEYQAVQIQLNKRFSNGWALYNNLTLSKLETTGSGAWWDNSSSSFGQDLQEVVTQAHVDGCQALQATRTIPVDCVALLTPHIGQPISTVNRAGRDGLGGGVGPGDGFFGSGVDRPFIWKTFGFKVWTIGKHSLNLGGMLNYQDGSAWGRGEQIAAPSANDPINTVYIPLERNGTRRLDPHYDLNMSFAWTFPIRSEFTGQVRIEGTNVTNQQDQINVGLYGEPLRVRREFQRPRQWRASLAFHF